jgi:hypothetical protein
MGWLFGTNKSRDHRREEEEQSIKHSEATRMLADLFIHRNSMAPTDIIDRLEQIHVFDAVPSSEPSEGEPGGYLEQIIKDMSHGSLTIDQTGRLVAMLSWPELRASEDRTAPSCILTAAVQNPHQAYVLPLSAHLASLEKRLKPYKSSQYQTDIAYEIRLTKGAIQACHLGTAEMSGTK